MTLIEYAKDYNTDKILFVPAGTGKNELIEWLCCGQKIKLANLKVGKISEISYEIYLYHKALTGKIEDSKKLLEESKGIEIIMLVLEKLFSGKKLSYFQREWCDRLVCREIYQTILLVKLENATLIPDTEEPKYMDLDQIEQCYQETLQEYQLMDLADLYQYVGDEINKKGIPGCMQYESYAIEEDYYDQLLAKEKTILNQLTQGGKKLEKLDVPKDLRVADGVEMHFFHGYGRKNEAAYIANEILFREYAFADVTVLCSNQVYKRSVLQQFEQLGIPVDCPGMPIIYSDIIAFMQAVCAYIESDYNLDKLRQLMRKNSFGIWAEVENNEESEQNQKTNWKYQVLNRIERTGVKLGAQQFEYILEQLKNPSETNVDQASEIQQAEVDEKTRQFIEFLKQLSEENISLSNMAEILYTFMQQYVNKGDRKSYYIGKVYAVVIQYLYQMKEDVFAKGITLSAAKAMKWLLNEMMELEVDASNENGVRIRSLQDCNMVTTPVLFVPGMNAGEFPVQETDSPILSDAERTQLEIQCLRRQQGELLMERFDKMITNVPADTSKVGHIYMGYSNYNLSEVSASSSPSLSYYKWKGEAEEEAYDFLQEEQSGQNRFQSMFHQGMQTNKRKIVIKKPAISTDSVDTDAFISGVGRKQYDHVSATALKELLYCPRAYYYHYLCGLKAEETIDTSRKWLDYKEKGLLVHAILEDYVKRVYVNQETAVAEERLEILEQLIEEKCNQMKQQKRGSSFYQEQEINEITCVLESYVQSLETDLHQTGYHPIQTEYSIGLGRQGEKEDEVSLTFPIIDEKDNNKSVDVVMSVRGIIDRIDRKEGNETKKYRIVDYKTGANRTGEEALAGLIVQDYLYKKAWEEIVKKDEEQKNNTGQNDVEEGLYEYLFEASPSDKKATGKLEWENAENVIKHSLQCVFDKGFIRLDELWNEERLAEFIDDKKQKKVEQLLEKHCSYCDYCHLCGIK